jgi:hypothetical protein
MHRVPDPVQRSSRCTAEPGPKGNRAKHGPRISSAPRRNRVALCSIRATQPSLGLEIPGPRRRQRGKFAVVGFYLQ